MWRLFIMGNMDMIEKLTLGKDRTEMVTITVNGEEQELELRPLTSGELSKLQTIEKKGFVMKIGMQNGKRTHTSTNMSDMDVNAGEFTKYQNEALYQAVAWSMNIEPEVVESFIPGVPEKVFAEVVRISNLNDNDLTIIKQFRQ